MLALRTEEGLDVSAFDKEFEISFAKVYESALRKNEAYLEQKGGRLKIKDEYLYVQNSILMPFMEENEKNK